MSSCLGRQRCTFVLLGAVWLLLLFATLWVRPVLPVDETRYIGVAWEMWLRGDWLVPHLNGEPYHHKPPLLFWLINMMWALFGVQEWAARVVPAVAGLVAAWLATVLARRLWPEARTAPQVAALVLFSGLLWTLFVTVLMFDLLVALCAELALLGLLLAWRGRTRSGWALTAVGIGLGTLAKGPVILVYVLPAALAAPWWMRDQRPESWQRWYAGVGLAVLGGATIALAWAIPAAIFGGETYREAILWGQTANRMVESFAHRRPFWWYLPLLPILLYPWSLWLPLWRALGRRLGSGLDSGERFVLAVAVPGLVIFSFISGKQPHYLLPLFPALALWAGKALTSGAPESPGRGAVALVSIPLILVGLGGVALPYLPLAHREAAWVGELTSWWGVGLLAVVLVAAWRMGSEPLVVPGLLVPALVVLLYLGVGSTAVPYYDGREVGRRMAEAQAQGIPVAHVGRYRAEFNFLGRLRRPVRVLNRGELADWEAHNPGALVVERQRRLSAEAKDGALYWQPFRSGFVVMRVVPGVRIPGH